MKVSEIFNLNKKQYELDFIDIDIDNEVPLFLDAHIFSWKDDLWSKECNLVVEDFFRHINELIRLKKIDELMNICNNLSEPNETCLGYSNGKPQGSFQKPENMMNVFMELYNLNKLNSRLYDVIQTLSDLKFFIKGVKNDTVSDIITNLIRYQLIIYTQEQCSLHNIAMTQIPCKPYWNAIDSKWEKIDCIDQLVVEGRKILLVPKGIVFYDRFYPFKVQKFAQHDVLNFLKEEELKIPNSSLIQHRKPKKNQTVGEPFVTKKDLREREDVDNKEYLLEFCRKYPLIMDEFRKRAEFQSLTIPQLYEVSDIPLEKDEYNAVIDAFISTLKSIPVGKKGAYEYHDCILGILTFVFYPSLTNPKKETPIDEKTKRIDICYTNTSGNGFFRNLKTEIVSNYIYVECKNYSKDVSNPEYDQLASRFNASSSMVGLLLCRSIKNEETALKKLSGHYRRTGGLIIPVTDLNIISMLELMKIDDLTHISNHRQEEVLFDLKRKIQVDNY